MTRPTPLALAALLSLAGCGERRGSEPDDAGRAASADVGSVRCAPVAPSMACGFDHVPAGRAFALPVEVAGNPDCACPDTLRCDPRLAGPGAIELAALRCTEDPGCGCAPPIEGTCELPALEGGGIWQVLDRGEPAFELSVVPEGIVPGPGAECLTAAARDRECGLAGPPTAYAIASVCHPASELPGRRVPIRVVDGCASCGARRGPCRVEVFRNVVRVTPTMVRATCEVECPTTCAARSDTCWTPPLPEGTWDVVIDGFPSHEGTIEVAPDATPWLGEEHCTVRRQ